MNHFVHSLSRGVGMVGREFLILFTNLVGLFSLCVSILYNICTFRLNLGSSLRMAAELMIETSHITAFISSFAGAVSVFHAISALSFANEISIGALIHLAVVSELGPIMAGLAINNKYCSYVTAKIAVMKTSEQLSVLQVFGIDKFKTILAPMVLAATIAGPIIVIVASVFGSLGGLMVAITRGNLSRSVIEILVSSISGRDLFIGVVKGMVFGFSSSCIACYFGINSIPNSRGIGRSVTKAIVYGFVTIFLLDLVLTMIM